MKSFRAKILGLAAMVLLSGGGTAKAELIITFSQDGSNVDASGIGSLNFSALSYDGFYSAAPSVDPSEGTVFLDAVPPAGADIYVGSIVGPASFGPGGNVLAASGATTAPRGGAGIDEALGEILVPGGYSPGGAFTVNSTWANTTISDLGLTPGTYTWSWGSGPNADDLEVVIPSIPAPPSLGLFGIACLALAGSRLWRKPAGRSRSA